MQAPPTLLLKHVVDKIVMENQDYDTIVQRYNLWPDCLEKLPQSPISYSDRLPKFLINNFIERGIDNQEKNIFPVCSLAFLGDCSTENYIDCPTMPDWYLHEALNSIYCTLSALAAIGRYDWFDFDIFDRNFHILKLRTVINIGDRDRNDGIWGVVWDRNTAVEVAHIINLGDRKTRIEAISPYHLNLYQPHNICFSAQFEFTFPFEFTFAQNLELEQAIGLAILWSCPWESSFYRSFATRPYHLMKRIPQKIRAEDFENTTLREVEYANFLNDLCLVKNDTFPQDSYFAIDYLCSTSNSHHNIFTYGIDLFSKRSENSLSSDRITYTRRNFLFHFVHNYLKLGYSPRMLQAEDENFADEIICYSDLYRSSFANVYELILSFQEELHDYSDDSDDSDDSDESEYFQLLFNSLAAKLSPSGDPITFYPHIAGNYDENCDHAVSAIVGTSCLILVTKHYEL